MISMTIAALIRTLCTSAAPPPRIVEGGRGGRSASRSHGSELTKIVCFLDVQVVPDLDSVYSIEAVWSNDA